jgi:hypothetical protein
MKLFRTMAVCALLVAPAIKAQRWEVGVGAGGGFYTSQDVNSSSFGSASAKIDTNIAASAWVTNNGHSKWGGELRYDYGRGDLTLSQGSTKASFAGETHGIHYDVLRYFAPSESPVRPFVAVGGGIKVYRGTGEEVVFQPLSKIALLTKEQDLVAMVSVGGGIKFHLSPRVTLRAEIHDYLSPFPKKVITPNVGAKVGGWGWLQDFVPMIGLSYTSN